MSAMSVLEDVLDVRPLEVQALPFIYPVGEHLVIAARCGDCGWVGKGRLYCHDARWPVAIACSLHVCVSPKVDLRPKRIRR